MYMMSTYPERLEDIGIELVTEFTTAKSQHELRCMNCSNVWTATPISKLQAHKKYGFNGCPACHKVRADSLKLGKRTAFIAKIEERFEILSEYDGQQVTTSYITVRNKSCGHVFESAPGNLIHATVECSICAGAIRSDALARSHNR